MSEKLGFVAHRHLTGGISLFFFPPFYFSPFFFLQKRLRCTLQPHMWYLPFFSLSFLLLFHISPPPPGSASPFPTPHPLFSPVPTSSLPHRQYLSLSPPPVFFTLRKFPLSPSPPFVCTSPYFIATSPAVSLFLSLFSLFYVFPFCLSFFFSYVFPFLHDLTCYLCLSPLACPPPSSPLPRPPARPPPPSPSSLSLSLCVQ